MDYFGVSDATPPSTPPPTTPGTHPSSHHPHHHRPTQRLRSSYLDLSLADQELDTTHNDYIAKAKHTFQLLNTRQKHLFLSELLNCCDNQLLASVHDIIAPRLKIDFLKELPIELSLHVLSFIDNPRDLVNASRVSTFWNALLKDEITWKTLCLKHRYRRRSSLMHPVRPPRQPTYSSAVSYRDYFWRKYNIEMAWCHGNGQVTFCPNQIGASLVTSLQLDDQYIVVGCDNHRIEVFDSNNGRHLRTLAGHEGGVWALQLTRTSTNEKRVVSGGCDRVVLVWDLAEGRVLHVLRGHTSTVRSLKVHADGKLAVTGSRDATVRIWDIELGEVRHVCVGHQSSVRCIAIASDKVVTGSYDTTARLWDINTGDCLHVFRGHHSQIYSVAFDGIRVATGSLDWNVRIWSPVTGQCLSTLFGHTSLVGHLQIVPPSDELPAVLVSGGSDGCLRVWNLTSHECIHRISAHDNSVSCLQADQKRILSGGSDGQVKLWNLETGTLIRPFTRPGRTVWKLQFTDTKAVAVIQRRVPTSEEGDETETAIELHQFDIHSRDSLTGRGE